MWLFLFLSILVSEVSGRGGLVAVGVYNTSTSCPSSCECPDDYPVDSVYLYQLVANGQLALQTTLKAGLNVSWVIAHPSLAVLYTLSEVGCFQGQPVGAISAWSLSSAVPQLLSRVPSGGASPVHLALTAEGLGLIVSNYLGNLSVFALGSDGSIALTPDQHPTGFGTHSTCVDPSLQFAFTPVLGEDTILQWVIKGGSTVAPNSFAASTSLGKGFGPRQGSTVAPNSFAASTSLGKGFGPRHLVFHPSLPRAFVADEGSGNATRLTVCSYDKKRGGLSVLQTLSVTNISAMTSLYPSEVVLSADGRFLYVSVRDAVGLQDSIAVLSVGDEGDLQLLANTPSGWYPRSMTLVDLDDSPKGVTNAPFLLVAAQKARALQVFTVDPKTGLLTFVNQLMFPDAVAFVGEV